MKWLICNIFHRRHWIGKTFYGYTGGDTMVECKKCGCKFQSGLF